MDSDLLEWLSYEELQELETDNLISELGVKLRITEKFNIEQILENQVKSQELIVELDKADQQLQQLQDFIQGNLDKIQELRQRDGPLETANAQYITEQLNISSLARYLSSLQSKSSK